MNIMWYRYEASATENILLAVEVYVHLIRYSVVKTTNKGVWLNTGEIKFIGKSVKPKHKWVSASARKRFAYPTKEQALNSLKHRYLRRKDILEWQLRTTNAILKKMENGEALILSNILKETK